MNIFIREPLLFMLGLLLSALVAYQVLLDIRRRHRRRKYGCSRCEYRRRFISDGKIRCTASCGNQDGRVCPA